MGQPIHTACRTYSNPQHSLSHTPDQGTGRNEPPRMAKVRGGLAVSYDKPWSSHNSHHLRERLFGFFAAIQKTLKIKNKSSTQRMAVEIVSVVVYTHYLINIYPERCFFNQRLSKPWRRRDRPTRALVYPCAQRAKHLARLFARLASLLRRAVRALRAKARANHSS